MRKLFLWTGAILVLVGIVVLSARFPENIFDPLQLLSFAVLALGCALLFAGRFAYYNPMSEGQADKY